MGKMKILHEVIRGEDTTQKISFDYNSKTASDQHSYMMKHHAYTFEELKEKLKKGENGYMIKFDFCVSNPAFNISEQNNKVNWWKYNII